MKTCFSIMPFESGFEDIDLIIGEAAHTCGLNYVRGDPECVSSTRREERFQDRLIPVMAKETSAESIPWILRTFQWAKGGVDTVADQIVKTLDAPKRRVARAEAS